MAAHAVARGGDVRRALRHRRDACEGLTAMASRAARVDARVVHCRARAEGCRAQMARRAIESCREVVGGLACRG